MKKYITYLFCLIFLVTQNGCFPFTKSLYSNDILTTDDYSKQKVVLTTDTINAFLMDKQQEKLVVIGEKYHYIFDLNKNEKANKRLIQILNWKNRHYIIASFDNFVIRSETEVSGRYNFKIKKQYQELLTKQDINFLEENGFWKIQTENMSQELFFSEIIEGIRYQAKELQLKSEDSLSQPYIIKFREKINITSTTETVSKILLTPLTIAADGIVIILFASYAAGNLLIVQPFKALENLFKDDDKAKPQ